MNWERERQEYNHHCIPSANTVEGKSLRQCQGQMSVGGFVDIAEEEEQCKGGYHGSNASISQEAANHWIDCKATKGSNF